VTETAGQGECLQAPAGCAGSSAGEGAVCAGFRISPLLSPPSRRGRRLFMRKFQGAAQRQKESIDEREGVEWEMTMGRTTKMVRKYKD